MRFALVFVGIVAAALSQECAGDGRNFTELIGMRYHATELTDHVCDNGQQLVYKFEFSPCGEDIDCGGVKTMVCQTDNCDGQYRPISIATNQDIKWEATSQGALWYTATGERCNPGHGDPRVGKFEFICNGGNSMTASEDAGMPCVYNFLVQADCDNAGADPVTLDINPVNGTARGGTAVLVYGSNLLNSYGARRNLLCAFGSTVSSRPARWIFDTVVECIAPAGRVNTTVPVTLLVPESKKALNKLSVLEAVPSYTYT